MHTWHNKIVTERVHFDRKETNAMVHEILSTTATKLISIIHTLLFAGNDILAANVRDQSYSSSFQINLSSRKDLDLDYSVVNDDKY